MTPGRTISMTFIPTEWNSFCHFIPAQVERVRSSVLKEEFTCQISGFRKVYNGDRAQTHRSEPESFLCR